MADIDHFKKVNDNFGYAAGDHILKEFALLLEKNIRSGKDWVARYGGEKFLVCLTDTGKGIAKQFAERMRKATEEKVFEYAETNLKITASFGVCTAEGNPDLSFEGFLFARSEPKCCRRESQGVSGACSSSLRQPVTSKFWAGPSMLMRRGLFCQEKGDLSRWKKRFTKKYL